MESVELGDTNVWDDSALLDAWDGALQEYKKYHSIHARGERIEEILEDYENGRPNESPDTQMEESTPVEQTSHMEESAEGDQLEASAIQRGNEEREEEAKLGADPTRTTNLVASPKSATVGPQVSTGPSLQHVPQSLFGIGQDETLRNLMMSWYYAGYYTGLVEGQSAAQSSGEDTRTPGDHQA